MKTFVIDGAIGFDVYPSKIRNFLDNESNNEELEISVSSPGGLVFEGVEIFNLFRDYSKNKNKITFKVTSLAASIASYILFSGNKIIAEDNATIVIHNVWNLAIGDYREMAKQADILERLTNMLAKTYAKKTKKSIKDVRDLMDNETFFIGDEAVKNGFVDEIIKTNKSDSKDELLMLAQGRIANCLKLVKESGRSKDDLSKAAALIDVNNLSFQNQIDTKKEENKTEVKKNMTKQELKAQHPEIYNEIFQEGVSSINNKLENIKAHLEFADIAPNEVIEAIKKDEEFSAKIHGAKYAKIQMNVELKKKREDDNLGPLNTKQQDTAETESDTNAYIAKMKKRRGL